MISDPDDQAGSADSSYLALCERLHAEACARGEPLYTDPATGLMTCTRLHLLQQGKCCESGCRHCPYGFKKVD